MRYVLFILLGIALVVPLALAPRTSASSQCNAPELICKASHNQDRSLYFRDHCTYRQKIRVERFKIKDGQEKMEEVRETTVSIEPDRQPDKTGRYPVQVLVVADTDKKGNPKRKVNEDERTLLSFGNMWDLIFFPLLPEKIRFYNFQEVVSERKGEKWYRFVPKPEVTTEALASGIAMLDEQTGEVMTIKIEGLHNLDVVDKEASKLRSFNATIDYNQYEGVLRMPTYAQGSGVSNVRRFEGSFRFQFEEGKYVPVFKLE